MAQGNDADLALELAAPAIFVRAAPPRHNRQEPKINDIYAAQTFEKRNRHGQVFGVAVGKGPDIEHHSRQLQSKTRKPLFAKDTADS